MHFYTNVAKRGNRILTRGYENGQRYNSTLKFKPTLYLPSQKESKYRTIHGDAVEPMTFDSPNDMRDFMQKYKDVSGFNFYGLDKAEYQYIYETFKDTKFDRSKIKECVIDIEVDIADGYPDMETANREITSITMLYKDITFLLGYKEFVTDKPHIKYIRCKSEQELIRKFLKIWDSASFSPDVVTGWNIEFFDLPYLYRRISRIFDENTAKEMSPWRYFKTRTINVFGREQTAYYPGGIQVLDYLPMYKKFVAVTAPQESYKLDHIAWVELSERKVDYSEYGNLNDLYVQNPQLYYEYNIRDCELVREIDDKQNLLELVYTVAYESGVNFEDSMGTVKAWDIAIHNYLLDQCVVVPQFQKSNDSNSIPGGWVKEPLVGKYDWIVSFDLTSLYPHLIMQYNIGPDARVKTMPEDFTAEDIIQGKHKKYSEFLQENNLAFAANSCVYRKDKPSFLSQLMKKLFNNRKGIKKRMLKLKQEMENGGDKALQYEIEKLDTLQYAIKVRLNSAYGALCNQYFRWFDLRDATAITLSGQLTVKWAEHYVNKFMNKYLKTDAVDYIVAVDTDSIYVNMAEVAKKFDGDVSAKLDDFCETKMQPLLDKVYTKLADDMNAYEQAMYMKREAISDSGVFTAKKRYMLNVLNNEGVQYSEPKIKIMGLESVRSSTPSACREAIAEAFRIILQKDEAALQSFISDFRDKFDVLPYEEIARNSSVNGLTSYADSVTIYKKGTPQHVRGALMYNHLLRSQKLDKKLDLIWEGDKIKYCYMKKPNPTKEDIISTPGKLPEMLGLHDFLDRETQFNKTFLEPVKDILDIMGWTDAPKNTLRGFFE